MQTKKHADINIFTVASGLLYEVSLAVTASMWILADLYSASRLS